MTLDLSLEAVGAERGVLLTLDDADRLEVQASVGGELRISTAVRDKVLREKASLLVRDVLRDQLLKSSETIVDEGVRSLMAVPLQTEDRVIGLMYLDSLDQRRNFTTDDLNLLTAMANVAGIRIERERWEVQRRTLIAENVGEPRPTGRRLESRVQHSSGSFEERGGHVGAGSGQARFRPSPRSSSASISCRLTYASPSTRHWSGWSRSFHASSDSRISIEPRCRPLM